MLFNQLDPEIWTVSGVLSPEECAALIDRGEALGFELATVLTTNGPKLLTKVRNNDRVEFQDPELADSLWERVRGCVPSVLGGATAAGLFPHFRFYRYDPGQRFKRHRDGAVTSEAGDRSRLTFMIYLNSDYEGGETTFSDYTFSEGESQAHELRVVPETGMGLFFHHERWHEGPALVHGRKYVLRTDVLYAESKPTPLPDAG